MQVDFITSDLTVTVAYLLLCFPAGVKATSLNYKFESCGVLVVLKNLCNRLSELSCILWAKIEAKYINVFRCLLPMELVCQTGCCIPAASILEQAPALHLRTLLDPPFRLCVCTE